MNYNRQAFQVSTALLQKVVLKLLCIFNSLLTLHYPIKI